MRRELEAYKARVREVAIRVADEQGWCREGRDEVLRELDIEPPVMRYEFEVTVRLKVTATTTDSTFASDSDAHEFANDSVRSFAFENIEPFDSDWCNQDVEVDEITIESVTPVEDD